MRFSLKQNEFIKEEESNFFDLIRKDPKTIMEEG
jgi:hypothetical protein